MIQQNGTESIVIVLLCVLPRAAIPTDIYRKSHWNHEYLKLRTNLFTCINRCYEQEKQCQYFISSKIMWRNQVDPHGPAESACFSSGYFSLTDEKHKVSSNIL